MTGRESLSVSRKYAMTRVRKGDYLLPSNDAQTLWRIYQYEEDGSLIHELPDRTEKPVVGWFWATAKRPMPREGAFVGDILEWDDWEFWSGPHSTLHRAIEEALRRG